MARQRRTRGMCNRLHIRKMKVATSEAAPTLIDGPHQDNLPVQPVAQRPGIERSRQRLLPALPSICLEGPLGALLETGVENPLARRSQHETRTQHVSYLRRQENHHRHLANRQWPSDLADHQVHGPEERQDDGDQCERRQAAALAIQIRGANSVLREPAA